MIADATIVSGIQAWLRLRERERKSWTDWVSVGHALKIGRDAALKAAGTEVPFGKVYTAHMAVWLKATGFDDIGQQVRYRLLQCVEHIDEIEAWRATLDEERLRRWNHPDSVMFHWRRRSDRGAAPRRFISPRPQQIARKAAAGGRAVFFDQDMIRRAAVAIRESWTTDTVLLAVVALRAAIRSETDVLALLREAPRLPPSLHLNAIEIDEPAAA